MGTGDRYVHPLLVEVRTVVSLANNLETMIKNKNTMPFNSAPSLLRTYLWEKKAVVHKDTHMYEDVYGCSQR